MKGERWKTLFSFFLKTLNRSTRSSNTSSGLAKSYQGCRVVGDTFSARCAHRCAGTALPELTLGAQHDRSSLGLSSPASPRRCAAPTGGWSSTGRSSGPSAAGSPSTDPSAAGCAQCWGRKAGIELEAHPGAAVSPARVSLQLSQDLLHAGVSPV